VLGAAVDGALVGAGIVLGAVVLMGAAVLMGIALLDGIGEDDCANTAPGDASASAAAASISRRG